MLLGGGGSSFSATESSSPASSYSLTSIANSIGASSFSAVTLEGQQQCNNKYQIADDSLGNSVSSVCFGAALRSSGGLPFVSTATTIAAPTDVPFAQGGPVNDNVSPPQSIGLVTTEAGPVLAAMEEILLGMSEVKLDGDSCAGGTTGPELLLLKESPSDLRENGRCLAPIVAYEESDSPPMLTRLERSNSCSQATDATTLAESAKIIETSVDGGTTASQRLSNNSTSCISIIGATNATDCSASDSSFVVGSYQGDPSFLESKRNAEQAATIIATKQEGQQQSVSSRFFSSKLNTGSLWSLFSGHSSGSVQAIYEIVSEQDKPQQQQQQQQSTDAKMLSHQQQQQQSQEEIGEAENRQPLESSRSTSSFFTRQFQFPNYTKQQPVQINIKSNQDTSGQTINRSSDTTNLEHHQGTKRRYRFNVKYIGNTLLHKNFTLPMLEWIAKDVKRQTIRGAQSINQRQFTIPAREIVFEIQQNQLMASSCKDGHCIFVHPMHCVSKYAQLQHDPTCFAYIIRDSKDSPSFCHVFQAKNTTKTHEIFSAIREVTTTRAAFGGGFSATTTAETHPTSSNITNSSSFSSAARGLQKSASTEGHWRSLLGSSGSNDLSSNLERGQSLASSSSYAQQILQSKSVTQAEQAAASLQFENSYQFEVMFVKRVKLQYRRVPASFVDDALETLKSFEVPKAQIKGVTKRIISASVDERQEYDEQQESGRTNSSNSKQDSTKVINSDEEEQRRGSSVSLNPAGASSSTGKNHRESKSCQQSPAKVPISTPEESNSSVVVINTGADEQQVVGENDQDNDQSRKMQIEMKKHQSVECLKSIDFSMIQSAKNTGQPPPTYANDFSPYNTITSSDLNERIAAIPVVSGSSVSLDHETRQKLARQVRETIMATAANIKKGVYASGDQLDSSSSCKALDSLSCNVSLNSSCQSPTQVLDDQQQLGSSLENDDEQQQIEASSDNVSVKTNNESSFIDKSRRSAGQASSMGNNFDLFRRASARSQVVKNRTMLLLIGKDELCAISIDKHQMLFSKSFSSIVHCLQGMNNRDHFGLICRDSGKINPQAESYAGFVFKCQSEKVVREIMAALRQVIYNSQHNYHAQDSPYNPLNNATLYSSKTTTTPVPASTSQSPKLERLARSQTRSNTIDSSGSSPPSLVTKRGFNDLIAISGDQQQQQLSTANTASANRQLAPPPPSAPITTSGPNQYAPFIPAQQPLKNPIKSMFCDDCPLYWFHRLCCDIESLSAEASKAIILRRIDSSLSEKEQDEVYSRFSEFKIESIDQHNEMFMSILRHLSERKQLRHNQSQGHQSAMAKQHQSTAIFQQQQQRRASSMQRDSSSRDSITSTQQVAAQATKTSSILHQQQLARGQHHQRSGSSSGSLTQMLSGVNISQQQLTPTHNSNTTPPSFVDASSVAIDNLKRAKNSISVSIENMLKRRSSAREDEEEAQCQAANSTSSKMPIVRAGSFKGPSSTLRCADSMTYSSIDQQHFDPSMGGLKRSQSSTDHGPCPSSASSTNWRESILSRTFGTAHTNLSQDVSVDLAAPLVSFFRRRGSFATSANGDSATNANRQDSRRTSTESLSMIGSENQASGGQISPMPQTSSSRLQEKFSGSFWKKNIFDKIHQPTVASNSESTEAVISTAVDQNRPKRSSADLRLLWQKAIREQITLLKMDKQNQELLKRKEKPESKPEVNQSDPKPESPDNPVFCCPCDQQQMDEQVSQQENSIERIKLNYRDVLHSAEVTKLWERLLKRDPTKKVEFVQVARLVRSGVPKRLRGEVWMFLMNQYQLRHGTSFQPADSEFKGDANQTYRSLLSQLSTQQHEIFVDIGRTFPTHPYYSQYLSIGQLSLFNLLKAFSLLDQEVGYCQGLSFVAGILLLHVDSEDEAFELMRHLLFNFGLRKQYLPSMNALHLQLYQITRLLRDYQYDIFEQFDKLDISPSLYAAPWFLTLFASQFPMGFVARLLDLIFLIGIEAIFRVSLTLLTYHKSALLECSNLEATMDFLRNNFVKIDDKNLVSIFDDSMSLDLRNKLIEYEIEYSFYCAEDKARATASAHQQHNREMRGQNDHYNRKRILDSSTKDVAQDRAGNREDSSETSEDKKQEQEELLNQQQKKNSYELIGSEVADATATVIIQHLLANNHLKSLRSNYSY